MIHLSERLLGVASLITPGGNVADIGTDHGYLSIYLIQNDLANKVIASDVNEGPLDKARENTAQYELNNKIELRLSNGLMMYDTGEVDSIVMAGMGGNLIIDIISDGKDVAYSAKELILQPQSDVARVRHFLHDNNFRIVSENIIKEDGKFYPMMKVKDESHLLDRDQSIMQKKTWNSEIFYRYGKIPLDEENPVLHEFLLRERDILDKLYEDLSNSEKTDSVIKRIKELEEDIDYNLRAISYINKKRTYVKDRVLQ